MVRYVKSVKALLLTCSIVFRFATMISRCFICARFLDEADLNRDGLVTFQEPRGPRKTQGPSGIAGSVSINMYQPFFLGIKLFQTTNQIIN